jgi:ABC-2 type transport system ATP-binding protein
LIRIHQVSKCFKHIKAVDNLSLEIRKGEYLALLGPNGAGKTTLVEIVEGLQQPDQGNITIKGLNWKSHAHKIRKIMGLSLQETRFVDKLTVREIINLFGSFYGLPRSRASEIIDLVNLKEKEKDYTVNLSGGQRQRLALGVALLNYPEILILDEPTTGLDPNARREIWDILLQLKHEKNTTMILTTHYMEEAEKLCDRIVIMDRGKIIAQGTLRQLLSHFSGGEIIIFRVNEKPDDYLFDKIKGITGIRWLNGEQHTSVGMMEVEEIAKSLPPFLEVLKSSNIELLELESHKKTLDDLFVSLTGRRLHE